MRTAGACIGEGARAPERGGACEDHRAAPEAREHRNRGSGLEISGTTARTACGRGVGARGGARVSSVTDRLGRAA